VLQIDYPTDIDHQGNIAPQPTSQQQGPSHEQENLYDNDINYNVRPTDPPQPTTEYSYAAVTHSRPLKPSKTSNNNGIEMNSCVAYGTTA
jgi:hypothetical protein